MAKKTPEEKLADAMNNLADRLEKFQDPLLWQKVISDAVQTMPTLAPYIAPLQLPTPVEPPTGVARVESISVSLSDEERERLSKQVYEALKPQLEEFNKFAQQSLCEMPAHRLKELAERIEAGAKPTLGRRRGCVFVGLDTGEEFYLGL